MAAPQRTASERPEAAAAGLSLLALLAARPARALLLAGTQSAAVAGCQGSQLAAARYPRHPGRSASHKQAAEAGLGLTHVEPLTKVLTRRS